MATGIYNRGKARILAGTTLLASSTIKAMLVSAGFAFDPADNFVADVVAAEASGTGYTGGFAGVGRKLMTTPVVTEDDDDNLASLGCASFAWTAINVGEVDGIVLFHEITSDALSPLISFHTLSAGGLVTDGGNIALTIPVAGLLRAITV